MVELAWGSSIFPRIRTDPTDDGPHNSRFVNWSIPWEKVPCFRRRSDFSVIMDSRQLILNMSEVETACGSHRTCSSNRPGIQYSFNWKRKNSCTGEGSIKRLLNSQLCVCIYNCGTQTESRPSETFRSPVPTDLITPTSSLTWKYSAEVLSCAPITKA